MVHSTNSYLSIVDISVLRSLPNSITNLVVRTKKWNAHTEISCNYKHGMYAYLDPLCRFFTPLQLKKKVHTNLYPFCDWVLKTVRKVSTPNRYRTPQMFELEYNLIHLCHSTIVDHHGITSLPSCWEATIYQAYRKCLGQGECCMTIERRQGKASTWFSQCFRAR